MSEQLPEDVWVTKTSWRAIPSDSSKLCRMKLGRHETCRARAEFEVRRGTPQHPVWWAYCPEHVRAYGNRIVGLEVQVPVTPGSDAAKRGWVE